MKILFLSLALVANFANAESIDRRPLIERAHLLFKPSLRYLVSNLESNPTLKPHLSSLLALQKVVESDRVKLNFVPSLNEFEFKNAPSNRFMGTGFDPYSPIFVSTSIMNQSEFAKPGLKPLAFVFAMLAHEYFNKVEGFEQGEKDVVAAKIAAELAEHEMQIEGEDQEFTLFSLPKAGIHHDLIPTGEDDLQASYALFINQGGKIQDVTDPINLTAHRVTPALRTGWTEANRMMFIIMPTITALARECQRKVSEQMCQMMEGFKGTVKMDEVRGFTDKMAKMVDSFKFYSAGELRIIELLDVKSTELNPGEHVVSLRARFSLDRSGLDLLRDFRAGLGEGFTFDEGGGVEEKSILEIPLVFNFYLKDGVASHFSADLKPNLKFDRTAKVGRISRVSGRIAGITVRVSATHLPQTAHLNLNNRLGSFSLEASRVEAHSTNTVELEFQIPEALEQEPLTELWADSVMIDQTSAFMLDRLIEIRAEASPHESTSTPNQSKILDARLEVNEFLGKAVWSGDFHPLFPLILINSEWLKFFTKHGEIEGQENSHWVDSKNLNFRFSLPTQLPIREVRVQINEEMAIGKPDEHDKDAYFGEVKVNGRSIPVWSTVSVREKAHLQRVLIIPGDKLRSHVGLDGETIYEGSSQAVISLIDRPLLPGEGYGPTMIRPVNLEVVLEDLSTLKYEFPTKVLPADLCNQILGAGININTETRRF